MILSLFYACVFALSFIIVISSLVFFHELGHYSVARFFNVAVERFSIGFGKPLTRWKAKSGTEWTINAIPLGGYVKFLGDAGAASNPDTDRLEQMKAEIEAGNASGESEVELTSCFHFKPLWQRVLIVLAGPVANFILAIVIFASIAMIIGTREIRSVVLDVLPESAAQHAGVMAGDQFLTLDGKDVSLSSDLIAYVALRSDVTLMARVERGGQFVEFPITPKKQVRKDFIGGDNQVGTIGVRIGGENAVMQRNYGVFSGLNYGVSEVGRSIAMTGTYIGRIFTGKEDGKALGGVVRIATMTGKTAVDTVKLELSVMDRLKAMALNLLQLSAALSIGLGVANLMPIPVLDGGHLLYYGYEAVAGRPLSEKKQELGFRIGFAVLMTLLVILTWNDIGYISSLSS